MSATDLKVSPELMASVKAYVQEYMSHYDASHDFNHILRVVSLARRIQPTVPNTSLPLVTLCALLHDVGDKKYLKPGQDSSTLIRDTLLSLSAPPQLAETAQTICLGVSYSSEVKDPERVKRLVREYPELGVVQDADRLDAIGAVGVGRCFAFGASKGRGLEDSIAHFEEKLVRLEGMMKTKEGRRLARERTERVQLMMKWWEEETREVAGVDDS
ncbi:HD domain-containing protein [Sarocladium implicatum]|nr:HD domain-containing protein [Sarocladium implicatum]